MQMMTPDEWRTPAFRRNMIVKIEEAIQQCGATMNAGELENTVFTKAKHKEEYMSLVTRIIMHIKDKGSKKHGMGPGVMGQPNQPQDNGNQMGGPMSGGQGMMNQMNPMTSMNLGVNVMQHQQGMVHQMQQNQIVHQMQPGMNQGPGQMIQGMNQQQQNQQSQQQHQMSQQGQGQMMGQNQISLGMNHGQISQMQHIQNAQMGNPQMQQQVQMQNVQIQQALMQGNPQQIMMQGNQQQVMMQGNQPQQQMMGQGQPQMMMNAQQQQNMMQATSQAQQGVMQGGPQQQAMMQGGPQQQQGMMQGPPQQQPGNQQQQQMMQVRPMPNPQLVANRMMTPQSSVSSTAALNALAQVQQRKAQQQQRPMVQNAMGIPRPEHGPNYSMNRLYYGSNMAQVDNVPVQFSGGPGGVQMQQRPVGPFVPSNASQGMPSPSQPGMSSSGQMPQPQQQSTFVNSPGSQNMMHRPQGPGVNVGGLSPFPNPIMNVPSPNTNLNTPMPVAATPSPRNPDDQACFEKIKELKKYTDLLQRMIAKIGNEDMEKSSKMKKLLEILTNPNQRVSMEILLKCEAALKKMERQQHDTGGVLAPSAPPAAQPKDQTSPFQQIQDAVLASLKNGSSSHTYQRTFRQSVEALTGQPFATTPDTPETESDSYSENELSLDMPGVLRRELKIIDNRFKVKVIRNHRSPLNLIIHVSLTEPKLPCVPPLKIFVPHDYPDESPTVMDLRSEYGTTTYLNSVGRTLKSRLLSLPRRFTVLELLQCWEMSVRQVSNPHYKITAPARKMLTSSMAQAFLL